jgi:hypothetical protein
MKKYNVAKIENRAIMKTRKILKIPESKHLSAFTYFNMWRPNFGTITDVNSFSENMKFQDKRN